MKQTKTINRYIPEKVDDYLKTSQYKNKEHLIIICDMIYRVNNYKKQDLDYTNQYTDIPQNYFRDIISDPKYFKRAKDYLIDNGIIQCDQKYSKVGGKALGYRFNEIYMSKLKKVKIAKPTLTKKIVGNVNKSNNSVGDKYKKYKKFFLDNFSIDFKKSVSYLDKNLFNSLDYISNTSLCSRLLDEKIKVINKYNHHFMSVAAINDGELFFRHNKTNGRIDTNLTNLKSELKQFFFPGDLVQLDIVNSQPYLLSLLLPSLCSRLSEPDVEKYIKITGNGKFYEYFQQEYIKQTNKSIERKEIKALMFCIFYSKNSSYKKEKRIFKMLFPTVMDVISKEKSVKHNQLAILMQKTESDVCIDCVCQELDKQGINYLTIHDAWLVDKLDEVRTKMVIEKCFNDKFKSIPTLDIKDIQNKK